MNEFHPRGSGLLLALTTKTDLASLLLSFFLCHLGMCEYFDGLFLFVYPRGYVFVLWYYVNLLICGHGTISAIDGNGHMNPNSPTPAVFRARCPLPPVSQPVPGSSVAPCLKDDFPPVAPPVSITSPPSQAKHTTAAAASLPHNPQFATLLDWPPL
uniref:Uncharacterized protein n=1 Tax=Eutreptiella gymnastica TaxID=73025 RepID=A0A7S4GFA5_9EUGL|mmetsp:Transcript_35807/g.58413  ORF Transcript_35807/g.58413 Transcript_35807/m.58413 type:complete len:156 (-) Transcript_35807:79-546(-)